RDQLRAGRSRLPGQPAADRRRAAGGGRDRVPPHHQRPHEAVRRGDSGPAARAPGGHVGMTLRFGAQLWSQTTTWPQFRDASVAAEAAGWDSIWTWDHLNAIFGPWEQPIFEGWSILTATAAVTQRIRLGLLVGANTFRNPGLTAKLATTMDHVSDGRAILGIGGAWFEREHDAYGFATWGSRFRGQLRPSRTR